MRVLLLCMLSLLLVQCTERSGNTELTSSREAILKSELLEILEKFSIAYSQANIAVLDSMIADEYFHTNTNGGTVTREQWLQWNRSRAISLANGEIKISDYRNEDVQIKILSPTLAIITGINRFTRERDGTVEALRIRYSHVWTKQSGIWQRQLFHDSRIPAD